jgi:hypothetical protein
MNAIANTAANADELGSLLSQIAALTAKADALKESFRDAATASVDAPKAFEGEFFKATVVQADRTTVAYAKLVKDIGVAPEIVAKYATLSAVFTVKISLK